MNTLAQTNLFDIIGTVEPKESFSGAVVRMDPSQERKEEQWAEDEYALYEVMAECYPAFVLKSVLAKRAGIGGHAFSARKSDLKNKHGILIEKRPCEHSNEYEYRLLPPKTEADQLTDNYFPTPNP